MACHLADCQAIIWANAGILLIGPLGTKFSQFFIGIRTFSFKKMYLKMSYWKCRPFCLGLNMLMFLLGIFLYTVVWYISWYTSFVCTMTPIHPYPYAYQNTCNILKVLPVSWLCCDSFHEKNNQKRYACYQLYAILVFVHSPNIFTEFNALLVNIRRLWIRSSLNGFDNPTIIMWTSEHWFGGLPKPG